MKIRGVEDLINSLDCDLAWRKKELTEIGLLIQQTNSPTITKLGLALLSAHFEGFLKCAAGNYLIYVGSQKHKFSELKPNFLSYSCMDCFKNCAETKKVSKFNELTQQILEKYSSSCFTMKKSPISTKSNPSSTIMEEILTSIGLSFDQYEIRKNYIDTDLLSNRHSVVHGERIQIATTDFFQTKDNILGMIEELRDQILEAAKNREYLNESH